MALESAQSHLLHFLETVTNDYKEQKTELLPPLNIIKYIFFTILIWQS